MKFGDNGSELVVLIGAYSQVLSQQLQDQGKEDRIRLIQETTHRTLAYSPIQGAQDETPLKVISNEELRKQHRGMIKEMLDKIGELCQTELIEKAQSLLKKDEEQMSALLMGDNDLTTAKIVDTQRQLMTDLNLHAGHYGPDEHLERDTCLEVIDLLHEIKREQLIYQL